MCKINAAVVCVNLFILYLGSISNGASRNPLAAGAKLQDDKMAIDLNTSGFYFTTK
ncbi:hypothetical protein ACFOZY_04915 [Chungangia koreensis]|uniref:Uncharacterized protein n=1 Tax=Chungangia koreensis TaxID=752657 RepID=A0ABV8X2Q4_9LACT